MIISLNGGGPLRLFSIRALGLAFLFVVASSGDAAPATNSPLLSVERIFDSEEFKLESYGPIRWRSRGTGYFKLEAPQTGDGKDLVCIDPTTGRKAVIVAAHAFIPPGETAPLSVESYEFSPNESKLLFCTHSKKVWRQKTRGDYWLLDIASRELKKLGGDAAPSTLQFAKFSPDGSRVAFVRENNLYVQNLCDFKVTPLTTNGSTTLINGTFDWVYEEELALRDGFRWSPDGHSIAYWQLDASGVRDFHLINNTDGLYSRPVAIPYPKAGEQNSAARIGIVPAQGGDTRWLAVPGDPRNHYLARMDWASNSTDIVLQQFNRCQNTNLVLLANAQTGQTRVLLTEADPAWVENDNPTRLLAKGKQLLWLSERDGWCRVYRVSCEGQKMARLTKGQFDVIAIEAIDEAKGWLYFAASPNNATQRYLYRIPLKGGKAARLTPATQPGTHTYNISPDAQWAIHTYSSFTNPPVTDLLRLPEHTTVRVLEDNQKLRTKLCALKRPTSEFFRVSIAQDLQLDGWCLFPPDFDPARKYPVLFYVYGEPAGQTVLDTWRDKSGLWHWLLAQQGYVVMSVDNRGTPAPRGRAWRKSIHGQIGRLNSADQAAAVRALLQARPYLDPARVGVWGWSGGGSSTLHAMLQYPELYHTGMAVASVPNQRYYDSIYQERYMGLPQDNPEGYRQGSPITYASQLKGNLLIVHGTGDDNVHYQGAEALINELIAFKKPFTMMAYPNRGHGLSEGKHTTYHLYSLLTRYLHQNLPAGPTSAEGHSLR